MKKLADISKRRTSEVIIRKVMKDTEEQLYHIKHRLTFLCEWYAENRLPSGSSKRWLETKIYQRRWMKRWIPFEYIQELKTLDIRMTGFIERHMTEEWMENCQKKLGKEISPFMWAVG